MAAAPSGWYPKRGEVYIVPLDKPRPAIVLSIDPINTFALDVCAVGITAAERKTFSMRVPNRKGDAHLDFNCWAKWDQVTTLERPCCGTRRLGGSRQQHLPESRSR